MKTLNTMSNASRPKNLVLVRPGWSERFHHSGPPQIQHTPLMGVRGPQGQTGHTPLLGEPAWLEPDLIKLVFLIVRVSFERT